MTIDEAKDDYGDNAISRAEMLRYQEYLHGKMSNEENHKLWEFIKDLPPITPQESIDYKAQYESFSKKAEIVISQLRADRDRLADYIDKIRAEIHATAEMHEDGDYYLRDEWIDEIFDKYKAESEKENGNDD